MRLDPNMFDKILAALLAVNCILALLNLILN